MEFSPRGFQRNNTPRQTANTNPATGSDDVASGGPNKQSPIKNGVSKLKDGKFHGTLTFVLFASLLVLFVAIILGISSFGNKEIRNVDKDNYQAVVLADGQAYFGKITSINTDYIVLLDVFYVQGQQLGENESQTAARLRKLGCEIHGPQDQMVIYRNQVNYWENLKSDGRVPELIAQFKEENPNGQTCSTPTENNSTTPSSNQPDNGQSRDQQGQGAGDETDGSQDTTTPPNTGTGGDTPTQPDSDTSQQQ